MKWLPPIVVSEKSYYLPLCDASLATLLGVLVAPAEHHPRGHLKHLLARDASLTIWTVWQAFVAHGTELRTLREVGEWLLSNPDSLQNIPTSSAFPDCPIASVVKVTRRAGRAYGLYKLTRGRKLTDGQFQEARLVALASRPNNWIRTARGRLVSAASINRILPPQFSEWLRQLDGGKAPAAIKAVRQANHRWKQLGRRDQRRLGRSARLHWKTRLPFLRRVSEIGDRITAETQRPTDYQDQLRRDKLAALKEFAYGASHEINNPLANISSRAQTLLRDEQDPERRRRLVAINSQAFRAHEMISDLMLFANPPAPQKEVCTLNEIARTAAQQLEDYAEQHAVSIEFQDALEDVQLFVDPEQIRLAVRALIQNAVEASKAGNEVTVRSEVSPKNGQIAEVTVIDHGVGLDERAEKHLFDPYFCGREAGRGLGFGLSKAWRIAEVHQGSVQFDSSPAATVFRLLLPIGSSNSSNSAT